MILVGFREQYPEVAADNNALKFISDNRGDSYNLCHCAPLFSLPVYIRSEKCTTSLVQLWNRWFRLLPLAALSRFLRLPRQDRKLLLRTLGRCSRTFHRSSSLPSEIPVAFLQWDRIRTPALPTLSAWGAASSWPLFMQVHQQYWLHWVRHPFLSLLLRLINFYHPPGLRASENTRKCSQRVARASSSCYSSLSINLSFAVLSDCRHCILYIRIWCIVISSSICNQYHICFS